MEINSTFQQPKFLAIFILLNFVGHNHFNGLIFNHQIFIMHQRLSDH